VNDASVLTLWAADVAEHIALDYHDALVVVSPGLARRSRR